MVVNEIEKDIYCISLNDRTTDLFEGLWPISREGVTYNSYLIRDEKTVMIDLAKAFKTDSLITLIESIADPAELDYLVVNHMEPDHTGAITALMRMNDKLTILCTPKAKPLMEKFYGITDRIRTVEDGETLSIGKRELTFAHIPFVHWPETMATYSANEKILFSCDAFGGYGALTGTIFDDQCDKKDFYIEESLRYFVNIVAKFSKPVLNAIEKLAGIDVKIIAPSHGLIWRNEPERIIRLYKEWSELAAGPGAPGVTLLYGTMYGNTERMMNAMAQGVASEGIPVDIFDVARTHSSYILPSLWTKSGVIIGAPTYEVSLFPAMKHILHEAGIKRITGKKALFFGSYGWSGGALKDAKGIIEPLKWELTDSLEFQGAATREELNKGKEMGAQFAQSLKG